MEIIRMAFLFLIFVLNIILTLDSTEAASERWKAISGREGEEIILYDINSITRSGPQVFRVWIMDFDKDHSPRKSLEEFDCTNRIVRDVEVIVERPNKPVAHTVTPSDWSGVVRESPKGELFKILCR